MTKAHKIELLIINTAISEDAFGILFERIGDLVETFVDSDSYLLRGAVNSDD